MATKAATRNITDYVVTSRPLELLDEALAKLDLLIGPAGGNSTGQGSAPAAPATPAPSAAASAPSPAPSAPSPAPKASSTPPTPAPTPVPGAKQDAAAPSAADALTHFPKVLIKVGRILTVDLVENSEKLYKLTVDVGGGEVRKVCAGLRLYLQPGDLQDKLVCAVCNLKPAKLAGNLSEAMLLAGDTAVDGVEIVRLLVPPAGSEPGEQLFLQGASASADTVKQLKSDHWKAVVGSLAVGDGNAATVAGTPLVTAKGTVTLPPEIPPGSSIH